jgi:hypothetical protein
MKKWKPIVKYNNKFLNTIGIFFMIGGISIFPFVVLRETYLQDNKFWTKRRAKTINHETIHFQQQLEMLVIPFYLVYFLEYLIRFLISFDGHKAYRGISFEQEAYNNEHNLEYLKTRKRYNWLRLMFKSI